LLGVGDGDGGRFAEDLLWLLAQAAEIPCEQEMAGYDTALACGVHIAKV